MIHSSGVQSSAPRNRPEGPAVTRGVGDQRSGRCVMLGELQPRGGGDPIPLLKSTLLVGRRESADIVLRFPNVSGTHCELSLVDGYWYVKDLGSSNGTKVNGQRITEKLLEPGDTLSIAKHDYSVVYDPIQNDGGEIEADPRRSDSVFPRSLLETAGLERPAPSERRQRGGDQRR